MLNSLRDGSTSSENYTMDRTMDSFERHSEILTEEKAFVV